MNTFLSSARKERGLTQVELADKLNISERQYQRIESGKCKPSCDVVIKLQALFNVSINKLLDTV